MDIAFPLKVKVNDSIQKPNSWDKLEIIFRFKCKNIANTPLLVISLVPLKTLILKGNKYVFTQPSAIRQDMT